MARPRHANRFNLGCDGFDYRDSQDLAVTVMACLSDIARSGPAVVVVAHLTKKFDQSLLYRTRGSLGLVCGARSILYLAADQQDSNRRILSQIKSVSGPLAPPIAFRIQPGPRLEFEPPGSAPIRPDLLALPPEVHSALSEACAWLTDALAAGPRPSLEILTGSRSAGISLATLNRAKYLLRVRSIKFGSDWCWSNPEVPENSSFSK
ncbi:MAG: hypothetical protein HY269_05480 [Deltaproteobacteria bacterium]|nr:hypothetical protein [Deltaproteobacteria bacterium]